MITCAQYYAPALAGLQGSLVGLIPTVTRIPRSGSESIIVNQLGLLLDPTISVGFVHGVFVTVKQREQTERKEGKDQEDRN